ncbi:MULTISPECIES: TonB-dependent receptor [unclassified Pseudomonas]|uniref:TonB-dependent siderophore receptor n=1 Tax=unclassified Pseudomonas TaxID=196821 RepID=UPI000C8696B4|nr:MULTISPECIES: TonB-dependent receptor [unclassified Pseudomonas]PMU24110.1 TonB-dependent siderophore receptor [Pseudomonas sp. GP01-A9]PMU28679.1 TonB-dependent siderophore receptor [Pseudomonas sp. GP01-A13]PMU37672.1 TonB-dependent siderophore receptor [Pseudomonas sp. GP01-A8]PMU50501.1 TonB-dependent siderophore receptor [Pseudomonas sp. GP01-A14]PMU52536.1 TonB-dependent siderophore receptor [Pseudomonas sp. GP01-A6]
MKSRATSAGSVKHWLGASVLAVSGLALLPLGVAQAAEAQQQSTLFNFALAAKPLPQALSDFTRVTGISVVYTDEAPYAIKAPAITGQMSAAQAMQRLLGNSGFTFRQVDARTLALEPLPTDGALNLGATTINGAALASDTTSYQPPPTSSVMRSHGLLLETPQTVNVVPAQVMRDQQPRNLDDALTNISGITQANTLGSTQDAVMLRGFGDNRNGSIMQDGMPLVQGRALNSTAERVEVLKGPSSLLYGIQDPGGVVNIVSKKPELIQSTSLTVRGSTFGDGKNGSGGNLDTTGPIGDSGLAYRLIVDHEDEDYWRNYGTHRESLIAPSLAWYGDNTKLLFAYEHREFLSPFDRGTAIDPKTNHPLNIPSTRRLDEPFNNMEGSSDLYRFEADHDLNDDWKAHFGYSWNRETYDASQVRVVKVNANGTLTRSMDGTQGALTTDRFATASLEGKVNVAGMQHDLTFGLDDEYRKIYRADLIRQAPRGTFNYNDPVYGNEVAGTTVSAPDSNQTDLLRSDSLFLQDAIHLTDQWILVGGARYQMYDQYAGKGVPFTANTDGNGQKWVPRAGLVYRYTDELSFYGSYTESFKPNSTIAPLANKSVLDGSLEPEQSKSWELGTKLDIPGRITASAALFNIEKRNVLVQVGDGLTSVYSVAGKVRSRGLELDASGQLTDKWSVIGSYAYTDAEVTEDPEYKGNRLQNVAKNTGSLSAVYDFGSILGGDQLRVGAGARYVGERAGDAANSFELPGYTVADAFATYDTKIEGQKVKFQLNVKNLFDRTYYTSAVNTQFVSIGDARQVSVSSTLTF